MDESVSSWAQKRFGDVAQELRDAVVAAIPEAHASGVTAQVGSKTSMRDPYGHTMKRRHYECLVEACEDIPGVEVFHPRGASFDLVRLTQTGTILLPWRYASDGRTPARRPG